MPFTVLGKKLQDAQWEVYLSQGDFTYTAREGAVVTANYRIEKISPPHMTLIYVPLNERQTLLIGDAL
ncbi:hypothetical protein APV28_4417 [Comamonas testosteroni]|nr:hypothetical protein APV28_4417 [Comamonas testosteroni]